MTFPLNPQAILLDLDGTLADSLSVMYTAYHNFLTQFSVMPSRAEFQALNGPPLLEVVRRLKAAHQLAGEEQALLALCYELIDAAYTTVKPAPGAAELVQKAKQKGCTVGVVTSNTASRTNTWLAQVNLASHIDFIVTGENLLHGKPHPEPYLIAANQIACPRTEIIAVEDSVQGTTSALAAGLTTFILQNEENIAFYPPKALPIASLTQLAELLW